MSFVNTEDFVFSRFVKSRFCSIHFTVALAGLKNIVRYTEDFVKSRFHCTCVALLLFELNGTFTQVSVLLLLLVATKIACACSHGCKQLQ